MKQRQADAGLDLDAGWDDIVPDASTISVKPPAAENLQGVDDLDAGWDFDEQRATADPRPRQDGSATSKSRAKATRQVATAAVASVPTLSKKARREIERQNRLHAEKRKAETKRERKQQRRAQRLQSPAAQPTLPAATASVKVKKASKPPSASKPEPRATRAHDTATGTKPTGIVVTRPVSSTGASTSIAPVSRVRSRRQLWPAVVVIVILVVAAKLIFF